MNKLLIIAALFITSVCSAQQSNEPAKPQGTGTTPPAMPQMTVPRYEGGREQMNLFIKKNLVIPAVFIEKKLKGAVSVNLEISETGKVLQATVIKGIEGCAPCSDSALAVVKLMPAWTPSYKMVGGVQKPVASKVLIPIVFE